MSQATCPYMGRRGSKFTFTLRGIASMVLLTLTSLHFTQKTLCVVKAAKRVSWNVEMQVWSCVREEIKWLCSF